MLLAKIDEFGKAAWIMIVIASFWIAWPLGLMALAFLIGSGRLGSFGAGVRAGRSSGCGLFSMATGQTQGKSGAKAWGKWNSASTSTSGNKAFDDYREETLRRLEDEEREFQAFLERLRKARDKSEFDAFMAERRNRPTGQDVGESNA